MTQKHAMNLTRFCLIFLMIVLIVSCQKDDPIPEVPVEKPFDPLKDELKVEKKEIRAAWITTVGNYDWPITKANPEAQKAELIKQLNLCQSLNFNAVILQIRPTADAFYPSSLEPWSIYLTGVQGQDPGYDPLQFAIDESHKRGMEFHAWLNPYRIGLTSITLASSHVAVINPSWMVVNGTNRYFNPGMPEVQAHLLAVVKDIVSRYEVDAIHFDDYFYPDGSKSATNPYWFNDKDAFEKYGNGKDLHTWRADNVNNMVRDVGEVIAKTKPGVLFGISPAGVRENSLALYADPLIWLDNRWIDYLAPQIYWEFGHKTADFEKQANYWNNNARGIPMVIGIAAYKFQDPAYPAYNVAEFGRQINKVRESNNLSGCFYFRLRFLENPDLLSFLKTKYLYPSLLPVMGKLSQTSIESPVVVLKDKQLSWQAIQGAARYVVYVLEKDKTVQNRFNAHAVQVNTEIQFTGTVGKSYFVTAATVDNLESEKSNVVTLK